MGHYGQFPNGNRCDVQTRQELGHMLTSRISIKEIHEHTVQLPYARTQDPRSLGSSHEMGV